MQIDKISIDKKTIKKSVGRVSRNEEIAEYYSLMAEDEQSEIMLNKAEAISQCYKYWDIDHYRIQGVKDIKRIQLCKDKFCPNCQNILSQRRETKYKPLLDKLRKDYDIYHIVFTVPNCSSLLLNSTLDAMYQKFPYIIQYLQGSRRCKHIDYLQFGYVGAVRGVEVTSKRTSQGMEYHPHFHCLFVFRKGLDKEKKFINDYSFSNGKINRKFTENEILLQKTWYLLYNGERLTESKLSDLMQGYSVIAEDSKGKYHQTFKYALKGTFKKGAPIFEYDEFKTLYKALYRRKLIQGYGILNRFKFEEDITEEEIDELYSQIIEELKRVEDPEAVTIRLDEVISDLESSNIKYISRSTIRKELKEQKYNEV